MALLTTVCLQLTFAVRPHRAVCLYLTDTWRVTSPLSACTGLLKAIDVSERWSVAAGYAHSLLSDGLWIWSFGRGEDGR